MAKKIFPNELAEVVTALLVKPELIGELQDQEKHQEFMHDIAQVVARHCGGDAVCVNPPGFVSDDAPYCSDNDSSPMLTVYPSDSLPSLHESVWSNHDPEGWDGETGSDYGIEDGLLASEAQVNQFRSQVRHLLLDTKVGCFE
ncbi:hypothetical protein REH81_00460 [Vibrio rotiferianus]